MMKTAVQPSAADSVQSVEDSFRSTGFASVQAVSGSDVLNGAQRLNGLNDLNGPRARVTRAEIIAEARTWKGTPWRHQGRLKGIASDCVGVLICAPRTLGIFPPGFDINGYARNPQSQVLIGLLNQHCDHIAIGSARGGDVVLLRPHRIAQHLGLLTFDNTIIHCIDKVRGVTEHIFDERWRRSVAGAWKYRGLDD